MGEKIRQGNPKSSGSSGGAWGGGGGGGDGGGGGGGGGEGGGDWPYKLFQHVPLQGQERGRKKRGRWIREN